MPLREAEGHAVAVDAAEAEGTPVGEPLVGDVLLLSSDVRDALGDAKPLSDALPLPRADALNDADAVGLFEAHAKAVTEAVA